MSKNKFIIIYDTYCGWCYGAAPIFDALLESGANVEVLHRHLFQGANAPRMRDGKGDYIVDMDARIAQLTGQHFSEIYTRNVIRSKVEVLDSSYSALAAALVHDKGTEKEFSLRRRLEKLRFVAGTSAQDKQAVTKALVDEGVDYDQAVKLDHPSNTKKAQCISQRAVELMRLVGSAGVPTILQVKDKKIEQVDHSAFYGRPELILSLLETSA